MLRPAQGVVVMERASRTPRPSMSPSLPEQLRQAGALPPLRVATEAVLKATVSVPWERPVHAARLAFLRRVARPGEVSVHVACGTDRLGFIDVVCGLTTILTDVDAASHYPRLIDPLLTIIAPGGSFFFTASEADILLRRARARQMGLSRLGEMQGYYDENVVLLQVHRTSA